MSLAPIPSIPSLSAQHVLHGLSYEFRTMHSLIQFSLYISHKYFLTYRETRAWKIPFWDYSP